MTDKPAQSDAPSAADLFTDEDIKCLEEIREESRGTRLHERIAQLEREREQSEFDLAAARLLQTDIATESVAFQKRATAVESALSEARALLAELNKRWGVRSGECNTCDLPGGKHSGDCPIPKITALLAGASGAAGKGGAE